MRPTLAIEENEVVFIPKKFHKVNDLCAIIYDQITEIYKDENYNQRTYATIPLKGEMDELIEESDNGEFDILGRLKENDKLFEKIGSSITYYCEECYNSNSLKRKDFEIFFETEEFYCSKCGTRLLNTDEDVEVLNNLMSFE